LFILRRKEPLMLRPYLAWGYPWTTGIALIGSLLFLFGSIISDLENALIALAMLIASCPLFLIFRWVSKRANVKSG
jgi:APA family basic amino acid/polyamine antiporter